MYKREQQDRGTTTGALWFERPAVEPTPPLAKKAKTQLNSGNVPTDLYAFYRLLAQRRECHISVGVAEALELAKPLLAEKYGMDRCQQCHERVEPHHAFCWSCGGRIRGIKEED